MRKGYQVADAKDSGKLASFLAAEGADLGGFVDLIEQSRLAVDELIAVMGRATVEAVLTLSARSLAGEKRQGKKGTGAIGWHGTQRGTVSLSDRKLRVRKPRLRKKGKGQAAEVPVPAYEAMRSNASLGERMLEILLCGVSSRNYGRVLPQMAETAGVSKSQVSRQAVKATEESLKTLTARRFEDVDLLVIYIDGMRFGKHHVIAAVGIDKAGHKHVLGLADGATENGVVVKGLLEDLVARGVSPERRRLFVIDGSKALRQAIDTVFGKDHPVQRCRNHKVKNVLGYLPEELRNSVSAVMKSAYRLAPKEGMARLKQQAAWLQTAYPSAASSLLEGLEETFTVNRLGLSATLRRCLSTTNLIESPNSGVRRMTGRVSRWRDGRMALRWAASAFLAVEKRFRRVMGFRDLWMLESALKEQGGETAKKGVDAKDAAA